jgi:DNA polymerase III delta prime subunit
MKEVKIKSIKPVGKRKVINLTVYKNHNFITANGIVVGNCDRISHEGQDALKGLIELTAKRTRYIFITNHIERVHEALLSRTQSFSFGVNESQKKDLIKQFFKRVKFILDTEKVTYDAKVVAKVVANGYPDFRKTIGELQKFAKMNGEINDNIFNLQDETLSLDLIETLKSKKIDAMRKIVASIDPSSFYLTFYNDLKSHIENESIPTCIHILGEHTYRDGISMHREINLADCCVTLMEQIKWKK